MREQRLTADEQTAAIVADAALTIDIVVALLSIEDIESRRLIERKCSVERATVQ